MSPNAQVGVHFSRRSFSPYIAEIDFESHAIVFSPDAGFTNGAIVVVAWTVVVVAMTGPGVVSALFESAGLHALTAIAASTTE